MTIKRKVEKRTTVVQARLTPSQKREVEEAAARAGITVSAWVTERILSCAREERTLV